MEKIREQFAAMFETIRSEIPGCECTLVLTRGDSPHGCTALTTLKSPGQLRATLASVLADSILAEGHRLEDLPQIAATDFLVAARTHTGTGN